MMSESDHDKIVMTNSALTTLIAETRGALRGEREFGVAEVRALSDRLQTMAPIVKRAGDLRKNESDAGLALDAYTELLRELQAALEQIHVMLLTRQSQMQQRQLQLRCISQWASALQQTQ
jgi:hypothetical protein